MLIDYNTTIALRCPICEQLEYEEISIFSLERFPSRDISCTCGYNKASLGRKKKDFWLQLNCPLCLTLHTFHYAQREFWSNTITKIECPQGHITGGFLGPGSILRERVFKDQELAELLHQIDCMEYFHDPETMLAVLDIISDIAAAGRLFCQCGEDVMEITMYPDHIELICRRCKGLVMVHTDTEDSLNSLKRIRSLLLPETQQKNPDPEGSFTY